MDTRLVRNRSELVSIYEQLPYPVIIQDITKLKSRLNEITYILGTDIREILTSQPLLFNPLISEIKSIYANHNALHNFGSSSVATLLADFDDKYQHFAKPLITQQIAAMVEGKQLFSGVCKLPEDDRSIDCLVLGSIHVMDSQNPTTGVNEIALYSVLMLFNVNELNSINYNQRQLILNLLGVEQITTIGTLISGISNDINNLLSPIIGYTEMALKEVTKGSLLHKNLNRIMIASERANHMFTNMQVFSEQIKPKLQPINIKPIIIEVSRLLESIIPKRVKLEVNISPGLSYINADATQLHHLLVNVCKNAAWAIMQTDDSHQGVIKINCSKITLDTDLAIIDPDLISQGHIMIEVSDNGCGIDDEIIDRVFDPFFTTKKDGISSGIGLAIVYTIAQAHNAEITIESKPNDLTRFKLYLPCIESSHYMDTQQDSSEHYQIICLDDEADHLDAIKEMLAKTCYRPVTFIDPVIGLDMLVRRKIPADLVLINHKMAGLNGVKLAKKIQRIRAQLPIIIVSSELEVAVDKVNDLKIQASCLALPFNKHKLLAEIQRLITEYASDCAD